MVKSAINLAIAIANDCSMYLLWFFARMFVAKRWIVVSNSKCFFVDKNVLVLDWRRFQSSNVGVALWMFVRSSQNRCWVPSVPVCRNSVCRMMTVLNSVHKWFPKVAPAYKGLSMTGGGWPKSPTRIIDRLSNEWFFFLFWEALTQATVNLYKQFRPYEAHLINYNVLNMFHLFLKHW